MTTDIYSNMASIFGGGVIFDASTATVTGCRIVANAANGDGGGLFVTNNSTPMFDDCLIQRNRAEPGDGGGMLITSGADPAFSNTRIFLNTATGPGGGGGDGGGAAVRSASPLFTSCQIVRNNSVRGGGFHLTNAPITIDRCAFSQNDANDKGGGLFISDSSTDLVNCLIHENNGNFGGGLFLDFGMPSLINCTVVRNNREGVLINNARPEFLNSIFAFNGGVAIYENNSLSDPDSLSYCFFAGNTSADYLDEGNNPRNGADAINEMDEATQNIDGDEPRFVQDGPRAMMGQIDELDFADVDDIIFLATITDSDAAFTPGSLAGRLIIPDVGRGEAFIIRDNLETTVIVDGLPAGTVQEGFTYMILDHTLEPTSDAADRGTTTGAPTTDIQGFPRPFDLIGVGVGEGIDIGAHETGQQTLLGFIVDMLLGRIERPSDALEPFDVNQDGTIDIADVVALLGPPEG